METDSSKRSFWDEAGKAGFVLGIISCAYMFLSQLLTKEGTDSTMVALLISLANILLWAAKFGGCIYLMKVFMMRYAAGRSEVTHSDTFRFGMAVALLSALIYAAFYYAYITFIAPDAIEQAMAMVKESYSSMMTAEAMDAMDQINFGTLSFFSNLVYCFLFGTVVSAIFSRSIPSDNPFLNDNTDNQ